MAGKQNGDEKHMEVSGVVHNIKSEIEHIYVYSMRAPVFIEISQTSITRYVAQKMILYIYKANKVFTLFF